MKRFVLLITSAEVLLNVPSVAWASHSASAPDAGWGMSSQPSGAHSGLPPSRFQSFETYCLRR